ncbi:hypothetical protein BDP55DRAFT_726602 [Colletotrichum godetiae]|uniref:Uncharacterized protein n=1 Tax=Colletotrichum godetiae TaxID=1209918 RepID=A0AAJ0F082_9PEZI|nr:uncharacterized protein BDP55DRAFT_726602 [Colletotrichum godetiae]KAK1688212.1 hypothetical protein BDP55DRAFT_726602 [Colletotrichum godetiae]
MLTSNAARVQLSRPATYWPVVRPFFALRPEDQHTSPVANRPPVALEAEILGGARWLVGGGFREETFAEELLYSDGLPDSPGTQVWVRWSLRPGVLEAAIFASFKLPMIPRSTASPMKGISVVTLHQPPSYAVLAVLALRNPGKGSQLPRKPSAFDTEDPDLPLPRDS